jgi:acyl-CoA thioester hydrolase
MTELKTKPFVWPIRVYFEDTDAGGVVYHSRYLNFFERARTELLRHIGISQVEMRDKLGYVWVVLDISVKFRRAARLDDDLLASAQLTWFKGVRQGFKQELTRKSDGEVLATAELSAAMLHADSLKPARMPDWIREKLEGLKHAE